MTDPEQIQNDLAGLVGEVLAGIYRLDALIGEGGMGAVFRGRHVLLRRDVAIKVLHPDFSRDPELVKRFDREAQSAARLNHPNCIQVTEFGSTEDGMKYLVMQLLEGTELQNILDGPVEPARACDLILQILRGLEHAHGQGVVHRDLKPQNIFVTRDHEGREVLKLVDFGIAKIIGGDGAHDQMTRAGMVFGTPQYMSPEQALGLEIDARADLYAAGVLLYQIVTGKLPFNGDDPVALIRMQVSTEPPPLPQSVPQELAAIIMRLLAKQKEQRFPDARTVRIALERYRESLSPRRRGKGGKGDDPLTDVVTNGGPDLSGLIAVARPLPDALRPRPLTLVESMLNPNALHRRTSFRVALAVTLLALGGLALYWFVLREPSVTTAPAIAPMQASGTVTSPTADGNASRGSDGASPQPPAADGFDRVQELETIDGLLTQNKADEAAARLLALHERFPQDAAVRWREAGLEAQRPDGGARALELYADALKLDPTLARDLGFHAQVDALLHRRPVPDAAIDLALALGPQGQGVLLGYINDPEGWASYAQRRRIRDALTPPLADEVDVVLNTRRDLEQAGSTPTPCQTMQAAITVMQAEARREYVEVLKVAVAPLMPVAAVADAEKAACRALDPQLASVRTQYAAAFPDAFPPSKPVKKRRPIKKKRKR
ncbi:MAG: serine/threonine protein kinase [Nannocystis sp.]|nr:serine/threonine-protein kinase [Nannocystis sp.]MBA3546057.1 serine/threonine protein kinase [Nannocystis sp.]